MLNVVRCQLLVSGLIGDAAGDTEHRMMSSKVRCRGLRRTDALKVKTVTGPKVAICFRFDIGHLPLDLVVDLMNLVPTVVTMQ